jgi:single-strand DNA-binding protein
MENKDITFMGRLGKDPELSYTPNKKAVCNITVAVRGSSKTDTEWKKVVVWERQAELCSVQLKKGSEVFVRGPVSNKSFKNQKGENIQYEEVNAYRIGFTNI